MKRIFAIVIMLIPLALSANEQTDNSVTIHNSTSNNAEIYISGVPYELEAQTSLRVPCLPEEIITVDSLQESVSMQCGEVLELDQ